MPRKKKQATVEEARTLKRQFEDYARDLIEEFEAVTGLRVERIDVIRKRKIGYEQEDTTEVTIITDL